MNTSRMPRVRSIEVVGRFVVRIAFSDDKVREVDLDPFLRGPIFDELRRNPSLFRQLRVDPELGTIVWPNGADIDPDVLYGSASPAWKNEDQS